MLLKVGEKFNVPVEDWLDLWADDWWDDNIVEMLDGATVYFGADVCKASVFKLRQCLYKLRRLGMRDVTVVINSNGGDAHEGFAAYDVIRCMAQGEAPLRVKTRVEGIACSAATLLLLAGHEREITENSHFLIHQISSLMAGKRSDLHDELGNIEKLTKQMHRIYERHSRLTGRALQAHLGQELAMTAEEALKHGFVDRVTHAI
jgi:ATP-dependent protease ClpP protease subunit